MITIRVISAWWPLVSFLGTSTEPLHISVEFFFFYKGLDILPPLFLAHVVLHSFFFLLMFFFFLEVKRSVRLQTSGLPSAAVPREC
jgi:hypothetical protein